MSNTGDKNNYYKPITLTGADVSSGDLYIYANSSDANTVVGYDAMKTYTTGSSNTFIGNNAESYVNTGFTEEQVEDHMKSHNVCVTLKDDDIVTVSMYEYIKIKNLVENEDKVLSDLTKEDFNVYLVTIKV